MCGITGLYHFDGSSPDPGEFDRFTDALAHRGPDGRGTWYQGGVALGHRRLAILDLTEAGACPLAYQSPRTGRRLWISFNGEIYNFLELRAELQGLGYRFRSESDTEVVVAAFDAWGEACQLRFNGMWAFAIYTQETGNLFISRDRFGVKPLYFRTGTRFAFASEMKAFLALGDLRPALNREVLPSLLENPWAYEGSTHETPLAGISRLPAGSSLNVDRQGRITSKRWWNTADHLPSVPREYGEQVDAFRALFQDAVRLRMRSDVRTGSALSGGIDSSAVVSMVAEVHRRGEGLERCLADQHTAYVATFPGTSLDERPYADQVIAHTGSAARYWTFDNATALSHMVDAAWAMEDIYGGVTVPIWCLYREMRRDGTYVSLDGHGGDELLGGYHWYLDWLAGHFNQNLYADFHFTLLPAILRNYDRLSMAHGIEVRMPIMDWRVVTQAFALPVESRVGAGYTKRILRDALAGIAPASIMARRSKIGFNSPMMEWLNGGLAPLIEEVAQHPLWLESPQWDGAKWRDLVLTRTRERGWTRAHTHEIGQVTIHMNLVLWHQLFVEREGPRLRERHQGMAEEARA